MVAFTWASTSWARRPVSRLPVRQPRHERGQMAAPRSAQPGTDAVRDQFRVRGSLAASKDTPGDVLQRDRVVPALPRRRAPTLAGPHTRDCGAQRDAYRPA